MYGPRSAVWAVSLRQERGRCACWRRAFGEREVIVANGGVEKDAKKLLTVLAGKGGAREGEPISASPDDAATAGFDAGPSGRYLDRVLWHLIGNGALEAVLDRPLPLDDISEPGTVYRITEAGLGMALDG